MSDGKLDRPRPLSADGPDTAEEQGIPDSARADRAQIGSELAWRTSGGKGGVAPMQRLMEERRAAGADLSRRIQRKAEGDDRGAHGAEIPEGGGSPLGRELRQRFEPK